MKNIFGQYVETEFDKLRRIYADIKRGDVTTADYAWYRGNFQRVIAQSPLFR